MRGIIFKIFSNKSIVYSLEDHKEYLSKMKGNLKAQKPLVGDEVEFQLIDNNEGYIEKLYPRKNELYRPRIANVDQVVLVSAVKEPDLSTFLVDKYLAFLEFEEIHPVLLFTKVDLMKADDPTWKIIDTYRELGYEVLLINNMGASDEDIAALDQVLRNKFSIFVGQTGAGKTSTLNNFLDYEEKTQAISQALNRGKHTTTSVALYRFDNDILLADSPGFSSFEIKIEDYRDLSWSYHLFRRWIGQCQFNDCQHIIEQHCAIKKAVEAGEIPLFFYEDYVKMMTELKEQH